MAGSTWIGMVCITAVAAFGTCRAAPGEAVALQGLHGNTLVAGKTTALRMYVAAGTLQAADRVTAIVVRPDGTRLNSTWTKADVVMLPEGSRGPSLVVRLRGAELPWVGSYQVSAKVLGASGQVLSSYLLDKVSLLPTKDLIVGLDRIHAGDVNPGTAAEIQGARDALARMAFIWPIRDGISAPDADTRAGLRYVINNQPQGYGCDGNPKNSDCQVCPFFASRVNRPPGADVMNLGIAYRQQDAGESMGGIAPNFCPGQHVGWASIVMTAPSAPGIAQETGHVFGLEPPEDPHYDHRPGIQAMHSKEVTIDAADAELGFDIQRNAPFAKPTYDGMHQDVCGCGNEAVAYNTWDWEYLRKQFLALKSTGPTAPSRFVSNEAPALAGVGGSIYFFARRADGRIAYNHARLGDAGAGWIEVEGEGRTGFAPTSAAVGSHVFVAIRGDDGQVQLNQADEGRPFGSWQALKFMTDAAPALAAVGNRIFVFAKGLDRRIYASQAVLGQPFSGWFELQGGGQTDASPAAAAVGTHVFVAIKGLDGSLQMNQADLGHAFSGWSPLNLRTQTAPGLASVKDRIFVFATLPDGRVVLNQAVLGQAFSGWFEVQGNARSYRSPAAASVGSHIFVAASGVDGAIMVNQAELGQAFGTWIH